MDWKHNLIPRDLLGGLAATLLLTLSVLISCPRPAAAQSSLSGEGMVAAIAADEDPADNIDRPAPSADYDRPAEAATAPASDSESDAAEDDQVLELPQVTNPASYATAANPPASTSAPLSGIATAVSSAGDADGSADPANVAMSGPLPDSQDDPDDQSADASGVAGADDVQSYVYQNNNDGGGPVVVYAARSVYVPMYPVPTQPAPATPLPRPYTNGLPMYSALYNRTLPMYSALRGHSLPMYSGLGPVAPIRYHVSNGSRLWGSPIGQGFGMAHSMMGGFSHGR
jgi:hypothetical protein